jgi:hypothetical protein
MSSTPSSDGRKEGAEVDSAAPKRTDQISKEKKKEKKVIYRNTTSRQYQVTHLYANNGCSNNPEKNTSTTSSSTSSTTASTAVCYARGFAAAHSRKLSATIGGSTSTRP